MSSFASSHRAFTTATSKDVDPLSEKVSPRSFRVLPTLNESSVMHRFVVSVETGDNKWAGTDEKVHIQLFGDRGYTSEILLGENDDMKTTLRYVTPRTPDEKKSLVFAQGSVREFAFMAAFVGNLVKIRVCHDGGDDYGKAWKLERVVVRDEQLQRSWSFACQLWLNHDQGNEVELVPTGDIAAGRRASMRLSRRRSDYLNRTETESPENLSVVAAMRSKFEEEDVSVPPAPSATSEGGVRRVCFQLTKNDTLGHMYLFGAIPALGQWDTTRAHRMAMHTGADGTWRGEWRLELEIDDDYDVIEYKYLQVDETNDKVHFSEEARVFKLSDGTDSSNRKVEGGVIYVRDSFVTDSSKSPFSTVAPGISSRPPAEHPASVHPPVLDRAAHEPSSLPSFTPSPAHKRNSLGFIPRGGSAFLVTDTDSAFITPDRAMTTDSAPVAEEILDSERSEESHKSRRRAYSTGSDGTAKLKSELKVTRHLLSESKMEMAKKDAELDVLNNLLRERAESLSAFSLRDSEHVDERQEGERSSPVSSESVPEDDHSEIGPIVESCAIVEEDAKSEPPEGTDSDSAPESKAIPAMNAIPILPIRRSSESRLRSPRPTPRSFVGLNTPVSNQRRASPTLSSTPRSLQRRFVQSPQTPSQRLESPALSSTPASAQRRYAQRLVSAVKVRHAAANVQRDIDDLRQDLKDLNKVMSGQCLKYEARQAELVRLMMDASEARLAEKSAMMQERDVLHANWVREFQERRKLFNVVQELKGNIRVFCRVRPLKSPLDNSGSQMPMAVSFPNVSIGDADCIQASSKNFEFSHVFGPRTSQEQVYNETSGVIGSVLDGYNVCVFAYGQTGSGKTHTMNGPENDRGVNFRALTDLFRMANERSELGSVRVAVSMIEIYNDTLRDLIFEPTEENKRQPKLEIRRDGSSESKTAVYVPNLTEVVVGSVENVWDVMENGARNRAMEATNMNEHSSRSHLILRVRVDIDNERSGAKTSGVLSLVDLAGSERVGRSQAAGDRLREAQHINKSLATLGDVFTALLTKSPHVPYRNSKLTYLLQDSLGGDSKTLMFVNVSCDEADVSETLSSLQFAQRVSKVELGSAKKHSESLAATKAVASLTEKEAENSNLKNQLSDLQREMKRRDKSLEDQKLKLRKMEKELKEANKAIEEKKKRDMNERGGAMKELRELRAADEKRQVEMRSSKLKMREVTKAKDDEIRHLQHQIEERDKRIGALEKMEIRSRSTARSSASSSYSTTDPSNTAPVSRPGRGRLIRGATMSNVTLPSSLSNASTTTSGARARLPRGSTVASSIGSRPRSVRFDVPDETGSVPEASPASSGNQDEPAMELESSQRRASSKLDAGQTHRGAVSQSDTASDSGVSHRRATFTGVSDVVSDSGLSHRRASTRIGEPRRISSMSSIARLGTNGSVPPRFVRPSPVPTIETPGSNSESTPSVNTRPTRPPRSSTLKKPSRNLGLAARNANRPGLPRASTFASGSGAGRNTASRAVSKAEGKSTSTSSS